jgi:dUTP pyrophosphatase
MLNLAISRKPRQPVIRVKVLPHAEGLALPEYQTPQSAGMCMELPAGYEGQIRPRSGLALNYGVTVLNSPGTIDADYRGEVKVLLVNLGLDTFAVERGTRIAQLVIQQVARVSLDVVTELEGSDRGNGGFGSTGRD